MERFDKSPDFPRFQKMVFGFRAPSKGLLSFHKCFKDKVAARFDRVQEFRHSLSVEIVEDHDDVEAGFGNFDGSQVSFLGHDVDACGGRIFLDGVEPSPIVVDGDDMGSQFCGCDGVASGTAGNIQYSVAWGDEILPPCEPSTGPQILIVG